MAHCLYEVLGVSQSATSDQLRTAYKKLVMVWHPDKNLHRVEEATARFTEIQNAYDTLNDTNERAWYDAHRDSLVQGKDATSREPRTKSSRGKAESNHSRSDNSVERPEEINLWPYFAPDVFSGFGDSGRGFFHVYAEIFDLLQKQEQEALRGKGRMDRSELPPIGNFYSSWETVKTFYEFWTTFYTVKDYAWFDEYNPATAPDDRTRKWMERENAKIRKRHKEEFEERVRKLAAHARKRDPRVLERKQLKIAREEEKKKGEEEKKAEDEERRQKEKERERERAEREKERLRKEEKERERREKEKERTRAKEAREEREREKKEQKCKHDEEREKEIEQEKRRFKEGRAKQERERKEEKRKLEEEQRRKRERRKERERDDDPLKAEKMALQENLQKLQEEERSRQRPKQIDEEQLRKAKEEWEREERMRAHVEGEKARPLVREWSLGNERDWSRDTHKKSKGKERERDKEGSNRGEKEGSTRGHRDRDVEQERTRESDKEKARDIEITRSRDGSVDKGKDNQDGPVDRGKKNREGSVDKVKDMRDGSLDMGKDMRDGPVTRGKDKQGDTARGLRLRRTASHKISTTTGVSRSPKNVTVQVPLWMSEQGLEKLTSTENSIGLTLPMRPTANNSSIDWQCIMEPRDGWMGLSPVEPSGEREVTVRHASEIEVLAMGSLSESLLERLKSTRPREVRNGGWGMNFLGEMQEGGVCSSNGMDDLKGVDERKTEDLRPARASMAESEKRIQGLERRGPRVNGMVAPNPGMWFQAAPDTAADGRNAVALTSASIPAENIVDREATP